VTAVASPAASQEAQNPPKSQKPQKAFSLRSPLSARYVGQRLLAAVIAVWAVISIVFISLISTANPAQLLVPDNAPPGAVQQVSKLMGFDQPVYEQYWTFLRRLATGNLPYSIRYDEAPLPLVLHRLPASILLGGTGLVAGVLIGGLVGYVAATSRFAVLRRVPVTVVTAFDAVPTFFLGVVLIVIFAVRLGWFPSAGSGGIQYLVLPAAALAAVVASPVARILRTSLLDTMELDHVRTARAKGIRPGVVMFRHVLVNSLPPVINVIGVQSAMVLGGSVITESLFSWPGVGQLTISSINSEDYPVVIASVMVIAIGFVVINLVVDLLSAALDPRSRR
jgi:peptide/nickel transport system permease protein